MSNEIAAKLVKRCITFVALFIRLFLNEFRKFLLYTAETIDLDVDISMISGEL